MLDVPGWEVTSTESGDDGYGEVNYEKGQGRFTITWYPADSYESYVVDREHIVDPPAPGEPVEVLGKAGQLWAYSADDHTVIREVEDGFWIEFRGSGMDKAGYLGLLDRLTHDGRSDGYEASLPEDFVTDDERNAAIGCDARRHHRRSTGVEGPNGTPVRVRSKTRTPTSSGPRSPVPTPARGSRPTRTPSPTTSRARPPRRRRVLGTSRDWPVLDRDERARRLPRGGLGLRRHGAGRRGSGGLPGGSRLLGLNR